MPKSLFSPICAWLILGGILRSPSEFRLGTDEFEGGGLGAGVARPNDADCGDDGVLGVALFDGGEVDDEIGVMVIDAGALVEGIIRSVSSFVFSVIERDA